MVQGAEGQKAEVQGRSQGPLSSDYCILDHLNMYMVFVPHHNSSSVSVSVSEVNLLPEHYILRNLR